jgi:hypothetical protein
LPCSDGDNSWEPQRHIQEGTLLTQWIQKHASQEDSADDANDPDWTPEGSAPRDGFAGGGGGTHAAEEESIVPESEEEQPIGAEAHQQEREEVEESDDNQQASAVPLDLVSEEADVLVCSKCSKQYLRPAALKSHMENCLGGYRGKARQKKKSTRPPLLCRHGCGSTCFLKTYMLHHQNHCKHEKVQIDENLPLPEDTATQAAAEREEGYVGTGHNPEHTKLAAAFDVSAHLPGE